MQKFRLVWVGVVLGGIATLFIENHQLQKEVDNLRSFCQQAGTDVTSMMMALDAFQRHAPQAIEDIARDVAKEEIESEKNSDF